MISAAQVLGDEAPHPDALPGYNPLTASGAGTSHPNRIEGKGPGWVMGKDKWTKQLNDNNCTGVKKNSANVIQYAPDMTSR